MIGAIAVCAAVFFVDLYDPWFYFWMYAGVVMRLVYCVEHAPVVRSRRRATPRRARGPARDPYGWTVASGRRLGMTPPQDLHRRARLVRNARRARVISGTSAASRCSTCCWRAPGAISVMTCRSSCTTRGRAAKATSTASPRSPRIRATAAFRACASSIRARASSWARCPPPMRTSTTSRRPAPTPASPRGTAA